MVNMQVYQIHILAKSLKLIFNSLVNRKAIEADELMKLLNNLDVIIKETDPNGAE